MGRLALVPPLSGIPPRSSVAQDIEPLSRHGLPWSDAERDALNLWLNRGESYAFIARKLGRTVRAVIWQVNPEAYEAKKPLGQRFKQPSKSFVMKYVGTCRVCLKTIPPGSVGHYLGPELLAHGTCF